MWYNEKRQNRQQEGTKNHGTCSSQKRIAELSKELEAHNYRYYVLNDPTVSDFSYDEMMRELRELEAAFPSLQLPTSPTQRVGGVASSTFEKVQHAVQMMSLQDVFSFAEVSAFLTRCKEQFSNPKFVVEPKSTGFLFRWNIPTGSSPVARPVAMDLSGKMSPKT